MPPVNSLSVTYSTLECFIYLVTRYILSEYGESVDVHSLLTFQVLNCDQCLFIISERGKIEDTYSRGNYSEIML